MDDREEIEQAFGQAIAEIEALVSEDAIGQPVLFYLREISTVPRLDRAHEAELAARARRDPDAKQSLTEANLLVVAVLAWREAANRIRTRGDATVAGNVLDLIQDGNMALIRAVESFDTDSGLSFSEYAQSRIREALRGSPDDGPDATGRPSPLP